MISQTEAGQTDRAAAGFTLIEMIIVLVVLGLVAGIVISHGPQRSPTVDLRSAATRVMMGLRGARAQAIASGQSAAFTLAPGAHAYQIGAGPKQDLPADVAVRLQNGGRPARAISFAPDGSSGGGSVVLSNPSRRIEVSVNWLSGRIQIAQSAPATP